ncbi:hypothetical protein PR048_019072 [Dryococelus australis]|uniref:Uncharacterized protein n=1 Tax=Dryococelus australis TaxID=614101 RepID=A0ABQ9H2H9_9NEOP|nr:hypothetical protein PR048_019072 [Dryococelus australis]
MHVAMWPVTEGRNRQRRESFRERRTTEHAQWRTVARLALLLVPVIFNLLENCDKTCNNYSLMLLVKHHKNTLDRKEFKTWETLMKMWLGDSRVSLLLVECVGKLGSSVMAMTPSSLFCTDIRVSTQWAKQLEVLDGTSRNYHAVEVNLLAQQMRFAISYYATQLPDVHDDGAMAPASWPTVWYLNILRHPRTWGSLIRHLGRRQVAELSPHLSCNSPIALGETYHSFSFVIQTRTRNMPWNITLQYIDLSSDCALIDSLEKPLRCASASPALLLCVISLQCEMLAKMSCHGKNGTEHEVLKKDVYIGLMNTPWRSLPRLAFTVQYSLIEQVGQSKRQRKHKYGVVRQEGVEANYIIEIFCMEQVVTFQMSVFHPVQDFRLSVSIPTVLMLAVCRLNSRWSLVQLLCSLTFFERLALELLVLANVYTLPLAKVKQYGTIWCGACTSLRYTMCCTGTCIRVGNTTIELEQEERQNLGERLDFNT